MVNIPKIKKKLNSFLTKEEGKISKDKIIKTGIIITVMGAMAGSSSAITMGEDQCNEINSRMENFEPTEKHYNEITSIDKDNSYSSASHNHAVTTYDYSQHTSHSNEDTGGGHCSGGWCD